ncbi:hypothetical protein EGW08_003108 [Elysia chlorotica]|uniref:Transcription initiation factor IIB n=1 Tax=Elysia chlorotica TaxID=188477 RepID=A0A3S1HZ87_ELYCH|nr:hypothetical protein EGW08_003108 [Elysia chlorotica]
MASTSRGASAQVICPEHPDTPLVEDYHAGDMICSLCGLVVGDRVIDVGSEWRTFSNEKSTKDNSRVGGPENSLFDGSDMSTMIATGPGSDGPRDQYGKPMYRNRGTISSADRALHTAVREISQMADRLNVPKSLQDRANNLFKQVHEGKALKGRSSDAIVSACMYIACRQDQVPRTFKEICAVSKTSKKEIGRVFKLILRNLETNVDIIKTGDFMSRFCSQLALPTAVSKAATYIAKKAQDMDLVPGRSPVSVTAAAIYMASQASGDKKTSKEVSDVTGVAEATIRQSYKAMIPKAIDLFPEGFKFVTPIECLPLN